MININDAVSNGKNERSKSQVVKIVWQICSAHVIGYFLAGIFALMFLGYDEWFTQGYLSLKMRPTSCAG